MTPGAPITFTHERGIDVDATVVRIPERDPTYVVVHVKPETMTRHGLDRETRHRLGGMTRWVRRSRVHPEPADPGNVVELAAYRHERDDDPDPPTDGGSPAAAKVLDLTGVLNARAGAFNARRAA